MTTKQQEYAEQLAKEHVDWFLETIRPLLMTFSIHFFKHGVEHYENKPIDYEVVEQKKEQQK